MSRPREINRITIPVDDQWRPFLLTGPIVHIATRQNHIVELWFIAHADDPVKTELCVFGTGQALPAEAGHVGTAVTPDGRFVWHLMRRDPSGGTR